MAYDSINLETLKNQFHSRSVNFQNFKNITNEDVARIRELINAKLPKIENTKTYDRNQGLDNYINTLRYLTNPTISQELKTFDEKVLLLILSCDPDLETMKTFLQSDITPTSDIEVEEDEKKKQQLQIKRNQEIASYESEVRKKIGFYDPKLLRYESLLHRGLFKETGFSSDIKKPSLKTLLARAELIQGISIISEANLQRLQEINERWLKEAKDPSDLNSLAYNLLNKFRDLHLFTVEEQVITFILIADPDLDLLRIYEEESNYHVVEKRAKEELGFYNKGLIKVEQLYHDKFEPERKLSAWTK